MSDEDTTEHESLLDNKSHCCLLSRENLHKLSGILSAFTCMLLMVVSKVSVQLLEKRIPDWELNTARCATPLIIYGLGLVLVKKIPKVEVAGVWYTIGYSLCGFVQSLSLFIAITFLPLATAESVKTIAQLVTGMVLFSVCWSDKLTLKLSIPVVLCTVGVLLVVQPWINSSNGKSTCDSNALLQYNSSKTVNLTQVQSVRNLRQNSSDDLQYLAFNGSNMSDSDGNKDFYREMIGYSMSVIGGLSTTMDIVLIKRSDFIQNNQLVVIFWSFVTSTVLSLVGMLLLETLVLPSNWFDVTMVTVHCLCFTILWPVYIYTAQSISGNVQNTISSMCIVVGLVFQYTVLSGVLPGHRNWVEVLGVLLVTLATMWSSLTEMFSVSKD